MNDKRTCPTCTNSGQVYCMARKAMVPCKDCSDQRAQLERLVQLCIANREPEELALGWLRYEALRRVNPRVFAEINRRNLEGEPFDDIVTKSLLSWKSESQMP